jgi:hypothetical protein
MRLPVWLQDTFLGFSVEMLLAEIKQQQYGMKEELLAAFWWCVCLAYGFGFCAV